MRYNVVVVLNKIGHIILYKTFTRLPLELSRSDNSRGLNTRYGIVEHVFFDLILGQGLSRPLTYVSHEVVFHVVYVISRGTLQVMLALCHELSQV